MNLSTLYLHLILGAQAGIRLLNFLLFFKLFRTSAEMDVYFLLLSSISALSLLPTILVGQFMFFYHRVKKESTPLAYQLYGFSLSYLILVGGTLTTIAFLGQKVFLTFLPGLDLHRQKLFSQLLVYFIPILLLSPITALNIRLFQSEMHFALPYLLQGLPSYFHFSGLLYLWLNHEANIVWLAKIYLLGEFSATLCTLLYTKRLKIPLHLPQWSHPWGKEMLKNSILIHISQSLYQTLLPYANNYFLSFFPQGVASLFYYSLRIATTLFQISALPAVDICRAKISKEVAKKGKFLLPSLMREYVPKTYGWLILGTGTVAMALPWLLNWIGGTGKVNPENLTLFRWIFLFLSLWHFVYFILTFFAGWMLAWNQYKTILTLNLIFILTYFLLGNTLLFGLGWYPLLIPIALLCSTILHCGLYGYFAWKTQPTQK
ncbi:MAG: hypothetical protein D6805_03060 [Planctomycetota bacterium]|nr:MAG: hypothetical protein D6805_03060 [Planctomycetota bacterium]